MKEKELWQYFFNKPKKNYNKYMFEMPNHPNHLIYDSEIILSTKGNWSKNLFKNRKWERKLYFYSCKS